VGPPLKSRVQASLRAGLFLTESVRIPPALHSQAQIELIQQQLPRQIAADQLVAPARLAAVQAASPTAHREAETAKAHRG